MNKLILIICLLCQTALLGAQVTNVGEMFSDAILKRHTPTIDFFTHKGWDHANSIILDGMAKLCKSVPLTPAKREAYLQYIQAFVDTFVDEQGNISQLKTELDGIHPGVLCLFLFEETGDAKYKLAATNLKDYLLGTAKAPSQFHRTPDGGFWHKNTDHYENVMTVDGVYMLIPFLLKYGILFSDSTCVDEAVEQTLLVASRTFNISNHLPYHGWDYSKTKAWSNPITGTSSEVWSRSIGWFSMALADILEILPPSNANFDRILYLYRDLALGIKETQNIRDGLWYQVINKPELTNNYPESSGSGMIIFALQKGVRLGMLDADYALVAAHGWKGLQHFVGKHADGLPDIQSFCPGMGIKNSAVEYVAVRPVSSPTNEPKQQPHGYCAVLMAASEMERK